MKIDKIKENYDLELSIKSTLDDTSNQINELLEDEKVQRYLGLITFYNKHKDLLNKNGNQILDEVIESTPPVEELENTFFCFGKEFMGRPKKVGGYYISEGNQFSSATKVALYKRLSGSPISIIIPAEETQDFEKDRQIIYPQTPQLGEEFLLVRRNLYKQLMQAPKLEEGPKLSLTRPDQSYTEV